MLYFWQMDYIQLLGLFAGGLAISSAMPQILKIIKTKKTGDLSLPMYIMLCIAVSLWVVYGFLVDQIAIIVTNGIFLGLNLVILYLKIRHG